MLFKSALEHVHRKPEAYSPLFLKIYGNGHVSSVDYAFTVKPEELPSNGKKISLPEYACVLEHFLGPCVETSTIPEKNPEAILFSGQYDMSGIVMLTEIRHLFRSGKVYYETYLQGGVNVILFSDACDPRFQSWIGAETGLDAKIFIPEELEAMKSSTLSLLI